MNSKITEFHLSKPPYIYLRQSTPGQVRHHRVLPARVRDWGRPGLIAFLSRPIRAIGGAYGPQRERAAAGPGASAATAG